MTIDVVVIILLSTLIWSTPWLYGVHIFNGEDEFALKIACLLVGYIPLVWVLLISIAWGVSRLL